MRSIIDPPPRSAYARFAPEFGQRFLLTVDLPNEDAVEQWTDASPKLLSLQRLCETEGVVPLYLAGSASVRLDEAWQVLGRAVAAGRAEIGVRLGAETAVGGETLDQLLDAVEKRFGKAPLLARADPSSTRERIAEVLAERGLALDSSVRPLFDLTRSGGSDHRRHPAFPYWLDDERTLLEVPQTAVFWGLLRRQGGIFHPLLQSSPVLEDISAWLGLLERIAFAPEAATVEQAIRAIDIALDDGLPLLVFTCEPLAWSASGAFDLFCDWWSRVFAYLELRRVPSTAVTGIMKAVER